MAANEETKIRIEKRREIVSKYYARGMNASEIAVLVKKEMSANKAPSATTINNDIREILEEWKSNRIANMDDAVMVEMNRLTAISNEAWTAWERSKRNHTEKLSREVEKMGGKDGIITETHKSAKQVRLFGDPAYLKVILACRESTRKLLGLDKPEKKQIEITDRFAFIEVEETTKDDDTNTNQTSTEAS